MGNIDLASVRAIVFGYIEWCLIPKTGIRQAKLKREIVSDLHDPEDISWCNEPPPALTSSSIFSATATDPADR